MNETNPTPSLAGQQANQPCREKYWSELDQAGQLERTRAVVKHLRNQLRHLEAIVTELQQHMHMPDGRMVASIKPGETMFRNYSEPLRGSFNEEYF